MNRVRALWKGLKTWQKGLVAFIGFIVVVRVVGGAPQPEPAATAANPTKSAEQAPAKPTAPPFKDGEVTADTVKQALQLPNVETVDVNALYDDAGKETGKNVLIVYGLGTNWDETTAMKDFTQSALGTYETLFTNPQVQKVRIEGTATFTDLYGKDNRDTAIWMRWNRETAAKVEWKNFRDMAKVDPQRAYLLADAYVIHPALYKKLDAKVKTGLPAMSSK